MSSALVGRNSGELEKQQYRNSGPGGNSRGTSSGGVVCYHCHKSLFPIEPRVFGCTCFVWDVRLHVFKLDPK